MRLSIIIPIYNNGKFLSKCIESCLQQDIHKSDYEIILINDGSTDNSLDIAQRFANANANVILYSQENKGLSETRNIGLGYASGNYIWFIDSDDWIRKNCLKSIIDDCEHNNLEAYQVAACYVYDNLEKRIYSVKEDISTGLQIMNTKGFYVCVPFTIYRRDFLLKYELQFYPGIFHEDCEFSPRSYYFLNRVSGTNSITYFVYNNLESITHKVNAKRAYDLLFVLKRLDDFSGEFDKKTKQIYSKLISYYLNLILRFGNELSKEEQTNLNKAIYENRRYFKHFRMTDNLKYKFEGYFFGIFFKKALYIFRVIYKMSYGFFNTK